MTQQRITPAEAVAEATGQDVEEIKEAWENIEQDQQEVHDAVTETDT